MYDGGADVVYQAAGGSGTGVFKAAKAKGKLAIGVDSDQYNTVDAGPQGRHHHLDAQARRHGRVPLRQGRVGAGNFTAGQTVFDLKADGVGYSTSGGKVDDIKAKLDEYKQQIIDGKITVPTA